MIGEEHSEDVKGRRAEWDHLRSDDFLVLMCGRERLRDLYGYFVYNFEPSVRGSECEGFGGECSSRNAELCRPGDPRQPWHRYIR